MQKEHYYFYLISINFNLPNKKVFSLFKELKSFELVFNKLKLEGNLKILKEDEVEKILSKESIGIVTINDRNYPKLLKQIPDPPLGMFFKGDINLADEFCFSIVGTRKATKQGRAIAKDFSYNLAKLGINIVSGFATGIDESAHLGAIEAGGKTIAILGYGIDLAFKRKNLAEKINLLLSEFPLSTPGFKENFPLRNRIIAGISKGVLVVEAPIQSGALITARLAAEYGRDVFVIPGDIWNINFAGSNNLIKNGAKLVTNINDILEDYNIKIQKTKINLSNEEENLIKFIENNGIYDINELMEKFNEDKNKILSLITNLEIKGVIKNIGGKIKILWEKN